MALNISSSTQPKGFTINESPIGNLFSLGAVVKGNGDIDGDGIQDFIISAPGANGGKGQLYVVFGGSDLTTSSTNTILLNSSSSSAVSLSLGDINGDGKDDIIIGDSRADGSTFQGKTYVIYGNYDRTQIATNVTSLAPDKGFTILNSDNGSNTRDLLGWSVSSGDIDGDGIDDVIIGDPSANSNNGNVHVIFGKTGGYLGTLDISSFPEPSNLLTFSDTNLKGLGFSVGSGDINGDTKDDLIIGARAANNFNGETYVVFGNTRTSIATSPGALTGSNGFTFQATSRESLGFKVSSAGDINGDNYEDLIVTAPLAVSSNKGRAYVVYGKNSGFSPTLTTSDIIGGNGTQGFYIDGLNPNDSLGNAISAAGDVNNDGIDDFLVAAPLADTSSLSDSGQVYLVYGRTGGFGSNINLSTLEPNDGWLVNIPGLAAKDNTGFSVSNTGDVNQDGIDDFLIGAKGANSGKGNAYVVLGQDINKPIPDTTVDLYPSYFYPSGYKPLIGEKHTFIVSFDNIASSPGNVGYSPFVNLYLDTTGTDGNANASGVMVDTYDGLTLIPNGIRYILDQDVSSVVDPNTGDTITDGLHSVDLSLLRITPISKTIYLATSGSLIGQLVVDHPYAGTIAAPTGFNAGDTLHVIPLPQGSFTPDQNKAQLEVDVQISNLADYNQPLKIATSGGFRLGANPVLNNPPIDPILDNTVTDDHLLPSRQKNTYSRSNPKAIAIFSSLK